MRNKVRKNNHKRKEPQYKGPCECLICKERDAAKKQKQSSASATAPDSDTAHATGSAGSGEAVADE